MQWVEVICQACDDGHVLIAQPSHELDPCPSCGDQLFEAIVDPGDRSVATLSQAQFAPQLALAA